MAYLARHGGLEGSGGAKGRSSLARFARAARAAARSVGVSVAQAFGWLDAVRQGDTTQWQIVYDLSEPGVAFRTRTAAAIKTLRLADFDFACGASALWLDIRHPTGGDARAQFRRDDGEANRDLLRTTLRSLEGMGIVAGMLLAAYPSTTRCE